MKARILSTVWINLLGIFGTVYLFGIISELIRIRDLDELTQALTIGFIGGLIGVIGHGIMFWSGFLVAIISLELIFITSNVERVKKVLIIEWLLISAPFIYWLIEYTEWIFLVAVTAFLITQFIRYKTIVKFI